MPLREQTDNAITSEIEGRLKAKDSRIVQIEVGEGSVLGRLREKGFTMLYGTSVNRRIYDLPHATSIRYVYCGSYNTHFPPSFFDCSVATGIRSQKDLGAVSELLKEGGFAIVRPGPEMDPSRAGLRRLGALTDGLEVYERISESRGSRAAAEGDAGVSILSYSPGAGGIAEYTSLLRERLTSWGKKVEVVEKPESASGQTVVVEYANGLVRGSGLVRDVALLSAQGKRVVVEVHDTLERFPHAQRLRLQGMCVIAYRANEAAERDRVERYYLLPHISFTDILQSPFETGPEMVLGSFGFAARYKRTEMLIRLARKLRVPLNLMVSLNEEVGIEKSMGVLRQLEPEFGSPLPGEGEYSMEGVRLRVGFLERSEIAREMAACSHIVFAHTSSNLQHSGVMTMAKRFSRPIVAIDSFQARQAQVVRVKSFTKPGALADSVRSFGAALLHRRFELGRLLWDTAGIISQESISREFLERHSRDLSRDEDGFEYMKAILEHAE